MPNVLGRKLFKKQSSRGKGITSMLEDFPQGFAEGGEVTSAAERKRLAMDMLARAREEGFSFFEEGERPSLTRQAAVGGAPAMGPDPRAAQQLAMMQQLGMAPRRFQQGGLNDLTDAPSMMSGFEAPQMMGSPFKTPLGRALFGSQDRVIPEQDRARLQQEIDIDRARSQFPVPGILSEATDEEIAAARRAQEEAVERARSAGGRRPGLPLVTGDDFDAQQQAGFDSGRSEAMREIPKREEAGTKETPPPPVDPRRSGIDVLIEDIKARREGLRATRDENKAMALIQAGLAIASGRSANALSNIGAGGLAGVQALREGERDVRREERELSGDELRLALAREQLAQGDREMAVRSAERKESAEARTAAQTNTLARETGNMLRLTVQNIDTQLNNLRKALPLTVEPRERSALEAELLALQQQRSEALQQYRGILGQLGVKFPEPQPGANAYPGFSATPVAPPK